MNLDQMRQARAKALASGWKPERARAKQTAAGTAKVYLDDVIDSWGDPFGISAKEFRQTLSEITADEIELHVNSPGGDAFEGVAMFNALRQHDARVTVHIDGLAASAASLVAMAGDEIVMGLGTQLMIHDAWALAVGNAETMQDTANRLDKLSAGYAGIYATRTGRPETEMRDLMRAEAWLNAEDAIAQGFADRVDETTNGEDANAKAKALAQSWLPDALGFFGTSQTSSAEPMESTTNQPTQEVTVAETAATHPVETGSETESPPTHTTPVAAAAGNDQYLAEITRLSTELAEMRARETARDRSEFFEQVVSQGRLAPADRAEYEALYDAAPEQTRSLLLARAVGSAVPVASIGHEGDGTETPMAEYEALFGKDA